MKANLESRRLPDGTLEVALLGRWQTGQTLPSGVDTHALLTGSGVQRLQFDSRRLDLWDSSLVVFLSAVVDYCVSQGVDVDQAGLPAGARRLLSLSRAVPRKADADVVHSQPSPLSWEMAGALIELTR